MRGPYEGKYQPLTRHLEESPNPKVTMTFGEVEKILGFALPHSARFHPAWWANQDRGQSLAWIKAGFRTSAVSIDGERLTFLRDDVGEEASEAANGLVSEPLSIAEAKVRLALSLGVDPSQIEITIRA